MLKQTLKNADAVISLTDDMKKKIENFYHIFNIPSIQTINELIQSSLHHNGEKSFMILEQFIDNGYNVTDFFDIIM